MILLFRYSARVQKLCQTNILGKIVRKKVNGRGLVKDDNSSLFCNSLSAGNKR